MSDSNHILTAQELQSKGGKARAAKLSPERRSEIASIACSQRKVNLNLPKAVDSGQIQIGDAKIFCAVLDNEKRVITETSMYEILGKSRGGRENGANLPRFLMVNNLKSLISNDFICGQKIIVYKGKTGKKCYGYDATLIPEICKIFLDAREKNILTPSQVSIARKCEIILHSLAKIGIISLIDEATGYQKRRENNKLALLFEEFIYQEYKEWTKKFPNIFFENLKKIYSLQHLTKTPSFGGHFINKYIYNEISPDILRELKERNPVENGRRKVCHHQYLTDDIGHPALEKQIVKINTLMSISDSKEEFDNLFEKSKR